MISSKMEKVQTVQKTNIRFLNLHQPEFFATLRKKVDNYFIENKIAKHGDYRMILKTSFMMSLYFIPYFLILTNMFAVWQALCLVILMGLGKAGIGLSVMHDALHGSYSKKGWLNKFMGWSIYLLGGNAFTWKIQHNVLHHTYTNIFDHDEDIETKFILRLSPHAELKKYHKYQHFYAFFLYCLMTFSLMVKDFIKVFRYNKQKLNANTNFRYEFSILILTKVLYLSFFLVLPFLVLDMAWWQILFGFVLMHFITGLILSVIFQLAHVIEETEHPDLDVNGTIENSWAIHQLYTTANFAKNNRVLSWYVGGLNYQVEHHLFPNICHVHYRKISEIVKNTALEFGLPYNEQPTFRSAVSSHVKALKHLGKYKANMAS